MGIQSTLEFNYLVLIYVIAKAPTMKCQYRANVLIFKINFNNAFMLKRKLIVFLIFVISSKPVNPSIRYHRYIYIYIYIYIGLAGLYSFGDSVD
jgi:hypothetical protein